MEVDWLYQVLTNITPNKLKISGVYCINNETNGKMYIGSSKDVYSRLNGHRNALEKNKYYNKHLQRAFNKYKSSFSADILIICDENERLSEEQRIIDRLCTINKSNGYNIAKNALSPMLGRKMSIESRSKISEGIKKAQTYEVRQRKSELLKLRWKDNEYRLKMSIILKNYHSSKIMSQETKDKISISKKGSISWNLGKTNIYSVESKQKMSRSRLEKSPANKCKRFNKETRKYE